MNSLAQEFRRALAAGLKSNTLTSCSRWAEHRRIMGAPFPGPYTFKYHPWARDVSDSQTSFNSVMKGAQTGLTEAAINRALYTIDILKRDVLYVLPTAIAASDFSKTRFSGALSLSPYIASIFTKTNTDRLKIAGSVSLYIRGSRGNINLKSCPASTMILDELDEMDDKQIWLAYERLSGQVEKNIWSISTPTIPKFGIHALYLQGTQEQWMFNCPHCGRETMLTWPDCIEIRGESVTDPKCMESFLKCKECGHRLEQAEKPEFLRSGHWVVTNHDNNPDHRSFHVSQLYSFTVNPGELVQAFFRGECDEGAATEFHNSKLGQPYIGEGAQVTDAMIENCLANYCNGELVPALYSESKPIVMGVDVGKRCNVVIMEFSPDKFDHDINVSAFGKILWHGTILGSEFERLDMLMREWQVSHCVIDADPFTNDARRFARRFPGFVTLCRYRSGVTGKEISISDEDGAPMATVDRTNWLDASLGRFNSRRIAIPKDTGDEFKEHIKAFVRTYIKDTYGNQQARYVETGADHYGHALNYAEIALPLAASCATNRPIGAFL